MATRAMTCPRRSVEESQAWINTLWSAYQADVTTARKLQPGALAQYADQTAALVKGAQGDTAKLALAQNLVTALKSREDVGEELKEIVGEDDSSHSYNGISLRLLPRHRSFGRGAEVRSEEQDRRGGRGRRNSRWQAAARRDRRRLYLGDPARCAPRRWHPGNRVARGQPWRERLCFRADLSRGQSAARRRQARHRVMGSAAASGGYYISAGAERTGRVRRLSPARSA